MLSVTRNAAVVLKRMTTVYAKCGRNPLFKCVTVAKVGHDRPKIKDCSGYLASPILPNMNVLAQVILKLEPEEVFFSTCVA